MKKLLIILGLIVSTNVYAEWTKVTQSDTTIYYISPTSVKDLGNGIKEAITLWEPKNGINVVATEHFDCNANQSKTIRATVHTPLDQIAVGGSEKWSLPNIESVGYAIIQSVCSPTIAYSGGAQNYGGYSGGRGGCAENGSCYGDVSRINGLPKTNYINGYYRSNGTYVRGHYRSK